jgi:(p)ppGpp synthase/HD superfamily hydrolase
MVGDRFVAAVERACDWHLGQVRKGTNIPYVAHLLAVASLVLEAEGDEELAIAAMLHDAIEDQPDFVTSEGIAEQFGERVADIVVQCSVREHGVEGTADNWRARKEAYVEHLKSAPPDVLLVSGADKLHNARSILRDLEQGVDVWSRFNNTEPAEQLWYYRELVNVFSNRIEGPRWLPEEFRRTVDQIAALSRAQEGTRVRKRGASVDPDP